MRVLTALFDTLRKLDGQGYGAYRQVAGTYESASLRVDIRRVQPDPFAPPSVVRIRIARNRTPLDTAILDDAPSRAVIIALEDTLAHALVAECAACSEREGVGAIRLACNGQTVLERDSVILFDDVVEIRARVPLPGPRRRIDGHAAAILFERVLCQAVNAVLVSAERLDVEKARRAIALAREQEHLRGWLRGENLVAFIADGSQLARRSGRDDRPLAAVASATPSHAPSAFARTAPSTLGDARRGLVVKPGVTVIIGGGYHGKSTLLSALARGVYNHREGDGREGVVTEPTAMLIRAEDGRAVFDCDISTFLADLPGGVDTKRFRSLNASGSTSQAANVVEAIAAGCRTLLIDEDTSATNFLVRDPIMEALVPSEPITPFVRRVRALYEQHRISTVIVTGASSQFLAVADHVVLMDAFRAVDATEPARHRVNFNAISVPVDLGRTRAELGDHGVRARRRLSVRVDGCNEVALTDREGGMQADMRRVPQVIEADQLRAIGEMFRCAAASDDFSTLTPQDLDDALAARLASLEADGTLARPRRQELLAAFFRMQRSIE
ncbi:MAG: ABC-ATPase domain-containing protein [Pseudomonadota bacterium]